jgi:nitrogenase iron protein NifH
MIHFVPRDNDVQRAEINRKTVIDWNAECTAGGRVSGRWRKNIDANVH